LRYLEEHSRATIDEAAMIATCLAALAGDRHEEATRDASRSCGSVVAELALVALGTEHVNLAHVGEVQAPALVRAMLTATLGASDGGACLSSQP
jgi:hypothetical protein